MWVVELQVGLERIDVSAAEQLVEDVQIPAPEPLGDAADRPGRGDPQDRPDGLSDGLPN